MEQFPRNRLFLIALTVLFIFAALFAEAFVVIHLDHECKGEGCLVCLQIETARLAGSLVQAAAFFVWLGAGAGILKRLSFYSSRFLPNPVLLKVRFNS